jgi:succinate dehydrogenase / fumarate reductase flavoprotein subunit
LGTNSLLDLLVFGKAAGDHIIAHTVPGAAQADLPANAADFTLARLARLENNKNGEYAQDIANDMRTIMQTHAGVFRSQESMDEGVRKIAELRARVADIGLKDNSKVFNTARIEALEVDNLMEAAQATMESAAARKECRGAHLVRDYEHDVTHPTCPLGRNDAEWMKHTLWHSANNSLTYKPVRMKPLTAETVPPKPRTF